MPPHFGQRSPRGSYLQHLALAGATGRAMRVVPAHDPDHRVAGPHLAQQVPVVQLRGLEERSAFQQDGVKVWWSWVRFTYKMPA